MLELIRLNYPTHSQKTPLLPVSADVIPHWRVSSRHSPGSWTLHTVYLPFSGKLISTVSYGLENRHFHLPVLYVLYTSAASYTGSPSTQRDTLYSTIFKKSTLYSLFYVMLVEGFKGLKLVT